MVCKKWKGDCHAVYAEGFLLGGLVPTSKLGSHRVVASVLRDSARQKAATA